MAAQRSQLSDSCRGLLSQVWLPLPSNHRAPSLTGVTWFLPRALYSLACVLASPACFSFPPARWIISIKDHRCLPGSEDHSRAWKRLLLHRVCLRIDGVQSHPSPNTYTTQNRNDHLDPFMGLPGGRGGWQGGNCQAGKPLAVRCWPLESELRALPVLFRTPPQGRIPQGSQTFSLRAPHSFWHPRLSLGWSQISFPDSSVSLGFRPHCTS